MMKWRIIILQNSQSFNLGYNIVKALFIKLPFETPNLGRVRNAGTIQRAEGSSGA